MPNYAILYEAIEELDLGVRAYNFCKRHNVNTIGEFLALGVEDINTWTANNGASHLGLEAFDQMRETQEMIKYWITTS